MRMKKDQCPGISELHLVVNGLVPMESPLWKSVTGHISGCHECVLRAEAVRGSLETLVGKLRRLAGQAGR
jgi:hypothetical protein